MRTRLAERLLTALRLPGMLREEFFGEGELRVWVREVAEVAFGGGVKEGSEKLLLVACDA